MKKILLITPHKRNCNSWWRSVGPFQWLERLSQHEIQVDVLEENFSWDVISKYDVVFLHRPFRPDHLEAMQVAKLQNIPVWADYDDWLFQLPTWNGCAGVYANAQTKMVMAQILACADLVSCSTEALKQQFLKVNPNVVVIPNADRPDMFPYRDAIPKPRQDIFVWRGTDTHDGDLESVFAGITQLDHPTYFLGSPLWRVVEEIQARDANLVRVMGEQDTFQYFRYLHDLRPKVMLFPLADHPFNYFKSNIAWLEAIHAGAMVVAPDLPEWRKPGVMNYIIGNSDSFAETARQAMALSDLHHQEQISMAREHIAQNYVSYFFNDLRLKSIYQLSPMGEGMPSKVPVGRNPRDPFDQLVQMWAFCTLTGTPMVQAGEQTLRDKHLSTQS